jgi:DNA-binding CsgD family transcriptional regulator
MIGLAFIHTLTRIALPYFPQEVTERRRIASEAEQAWRGASGALGNLHAHIALFPVLVLDGHWEEAERVWPATQDLPEAGFARAMVINNLFASWVTLRLARGDVGVAWSVIRAALPDGVGTVPGTTSYAATVAVQRGAAALALAAGDTVTARHWLEAHDRWLTWSGALWGRSEGHTLWSYYHRHMGDLEQARDHADHALAHATEPDQPLARLNAYRLLGELDTEAQRFDSAMRHLSESLGLADACQAPYERALTLLTIAELQATGAIEEARVSLDEARTALAALGATAILVRADHLAARLAGPKAVPPSPVAGLTPREAEVLRLLAAGLSNPQVADRLFLSTRTVERHLESIYRKISVSSRSAATRFAFEHDIT